MERELNIYFTADGRYYDPWMGKYLQPDAIGGPPLIPQAADRYKYAGNSPTGVSYAGGDTPGWVAAVEAASTVVSEATLSEAIETGIGKAVSRYARVQGALYIRANRALLGRAGCANLFTRTYSPGRGRSAYFLSQPVVTEGARTYRTAGGQLIDLDILEDAVSPVHPNQWGVGYPLGDPLLSLEPDTALKRWMRSWWGDLISGIAIEVGVEMLFQAFEPYWSSPYLEPGQKWGQFGVNIGFAAFGSIGAWGTVTVIGFFAGGPVGVGVVFVVGVGWSIVASLLADSTIEGSGLNREHMRLQPLGDGI